MPFDPTAPTDEERSRIFAVVWFGLGANAVLLASYLFELGITPPFLGLTGAMIFISMFSNRYDDYYAALRNSGMRWGMGVIALYLFGGAMLSVFAGGNIVGSWAASGEMPDLARGNPGLMADGFLLAIVAGLAYHLGFTLARLRGTGSR
ncbi:hypothetical protein AAG612_02920 [Citromicrobium bathyomarinum]|uniref:hypothetical protein n=1 Tax=Citromicrobium bathyomarinum TaxID=72174 RepID=UPI00315A64C2